MAGLIIQDTFDPYYVGREGDTERKEKRSAIGKPAKDCDSEIILPSAFPAPPAVRRRDRRAVAH